MLQDFTRFSRTFCICSNFLLLENQSTIFQLFQDVLGTIINHVCLIFKCQNMMKNTHHNFPKINLTSNLSPK